jgi:D-alanyl-D-alanine carboxypeptidase
VKNLFRRIYSYFLSILRQIYLHEGTNRRLRSFTKAVKEKSIKIGLENSNFTVPSGSTIFAFQSSTTCRDMVKIMKVAYENEFMREVWKNKEYVIKISGEKPRNKKIVTTVEDSHLGEKNKILGGKTGTLALVGNELLICNLAVITEINNKIVIAVVMDIDCPENRFPVMVQLLDFVKGETQDLNITNAKSYIACSLGDNGEINTICEKNADIKHHSASLAKVITTLTALDYIEDKKTKIKIHKRDLFHGSGAIFCENDEITFEDAIKLMMLCSSNQAAQAIARTVTEIIEKKKPTVKNGRTDSHANAN